MPYIFGYGSLVWKADFSYTRKEYAKITGYVRRFWHGSSDHRGLPESPGRVVTLISILEWTEKFQAVDPHSSKESGEVWGAVYYVEDDVQDEVFAYLDYREKNGYSLRSIKATLLDGAIVDALIYIAPWNDKHFLGPSSLNDIAGTIATSVGPSGPNIEYLLQLCEALQRIGKLHQDEHLVELRRLVLANNMM